MHGNSNITSKSPMTHAQGAIPKRLAMPRLEICSEFGTFEAHDLTLWLDDFLVSGTITNRTDRDWLWVAFRSILVDREMQQIIYDDRFTGDFYVKDIPRGASKPLTGLRGERPARFILRPDGEVGGFSAEFCRERSYYNTHPRFALVEPFDNMDLYFVDDWLSVVFDVRNAELQFSLRNRTGDAMQILWNNASYLDLSGESHKIIHRGIPLADRNEPLPPTDVEPFTTLDEMVYPADRVIGSRVFSDWRLNPLLPHRQQIAEYHGQRIGLNLPVRVGHNLREYKFRLKLADVRV